MKTAQEYYSKTLCRIFSLFLLLLLLCPLFIIPKPRPRFAAVLSVSCLYPAPFASPLHVKWRFSSQKILFLRVNKGARTSIDFDTQYVGLSNIYYLLLFLLHFISSWKKKDRFIQPTMRVTCLSLDIIVCSPLIARAR
ncbi:hypothetical protein GGI43DRAFT_132489 [Trichoderma evansii]